MAKQDAVQNGVHHGHISIAMDGDTTLEGTWMTVDARDQESPKVAAFNNLYDLVSSPVDEHLHTLLGVHEAEANPASQE